MKCPYEVNIEQANENIYEYDEDGHNVHHEHKLVEKRQFLDCLGKECAAWNAETGKCEYRGC